MTTATLDSVSPTSMPSTAIGAKLVVGRDEAAALVGKHLEKGLAIKGLRIKYPDDLDKARALKLEWTQVTTDLLSRLFDSGAVADFCNDWVGKIFPEYAEFGNFVEQFYEEINYRTARLQAVFDQLTVTAHPAPLQAAAPLMAQTVARPIAADVPTAPPAAPVAPPVAPPMASGASTTTFSGPARPAATKVKAILATDGHPSPYADAIAKFLDQLGVIVVKVPATTSLVDALGKETDASFAAILLDGGGPSHVHADAPARDDRAMLFELGFCAGRFGASRVCVLHPFGRAPIAGAGGIEHLGLDATGGWQLQLARLMRRCGIEIDLNKLC